MWYQFKDGRCISTSTCETVVEDDIVSVYSEHVYTDIDNLRLIDGRVVHVEPLLTEIKE